MEREAVDDFRQNVFVFVLAPETPVTDSTPVSYFDVGTSTERNSNDLEGGEKVKNGQSTERDSNNLEGGEKVQNGVLDQIFSDKSNEFPKQSSLPHQTPLGFQNPAFECTRTKYPPFMEPSDDLTSPGVISPPKGGPEDPNENDSAIAFGSMVALYNLKEENSKHFLAMKGDDIFCHSLESLETWRCWERFQILKTRFGQIGLWNPEFKSFVAAKRQNIIKKAKFTFAPEEKWTLMDVGNNKWALHNESSGIFLQAQGLWTQDLAELCNVFKPKPNEEFMIVPHPLPPTVCKPPVTGSVVAFGQTSSIQKHFLAMNDQSLFCTTFKDLDVCRTWEFQIVAAGNDGEVAFWSTLFQRFITMHENGYVEASDVSEDGSFPQEWHSGRWQWVFTDESWLVFNTFHGRFLCPQFAEESVGGVKLDAFQRVRPLFAVPHLG